MKKMQCEVCGGTTIKKIGESMFECQSCGIQYSNDEVKNLLVEVTESRDNSTKSHENDRVEENKEKYYEKEDETEQKHDDFEEFSCLLKFNGFVKGLEDKIIFNPSKNEINEFLIKVMENPYDCELVIKSLSSSKEFDEISISAEPDIGFTICATNENMVVRGINTNCILDYICEYIIFGVLDFEEIQAQTPIVVEKSNKAEGWIKLFGIFGLTPYTFIAGIFVLFFIKKAKLENDGVLSEVSLKGIKRGIIGFSAYTTIFVIIFIIIALG